MTPFDVAIHGHAYLDQINYQHDLCTACLKIVSRQQDYVENIKVLMHQKNNFDPKRIKEITSDFIQRIMENAGETERGEFYLLCQNTLVALCGGLENLVKDFVAAAFLFEPELMRKLEDRSIRFSVSSVIFGTDDERSRLLVDELYREEGARHGQFHRFFRLLDYIDSGVFKGHWDKKQVSAISSDIDEAYEVRNAIVHHGGKIDQRLASRIPSLASVAGSTIVLDSQRFQRYRNAINKFSQQLSGLINL
jgi:hypothetical protein